MSSPEYDAVMRERFGELYRRSEHVPDHLPLPQPLPDRLAFDAVRPERRTPGLYASRYREVRAWIRRSHPDWLPDLYRVDDGKVAHVVEIRTTVYVGRTVCGRVGRIEEVSEDVVPCRVCTW